MVGTEKDFMNRIVVDPKVMVGKPVIKGTRITAEAIVGRGCRRDDFRRDS